MAYVLAENGSIKIPNGERPKCDHGISAEKELSGQGVAHKAMYT